MNNYPNVELLEYKAKKLLLADEKFVRRLIEKRGTVYLEFEVDIFPQTWGSTATGFDIADDGSLSWGGFAITKVYTTVLKELNTNTYIVFFANNICYKVTDPTDNFYEDLKNRSLASLSIAKEKY